MLSFPSAVKIYLCKQSTDMRKSFDSLAMMLEGIDFTQIKRKKRFSLSS